MVTDLPRVMVAGTHSGVGKTLLSAGLMAALGNRGRRVRPFKVGPDFIDPGYHALASRRPGRNLDAFMHGADLIAPLLRHGSAGGDLAVVEGVMGLFDGRGASDEASSAHIARLTRTPVILVVDAASASRSVAAQIHGFHTFHPEVGLAGVIFNRVGSDRHEALLREAAAQVAVPVVGAVRRHDRLRVDSRHLGLIPTAEAHHSAADAVDAAAEIMAREVDLPAVEAIAAEAGELGTARWEPGSRVTPVNRPVRIAVATGAAFSFHYTEHTELLEAAGSEVVRFDPLADESLPSGLHGLYIGGGFPEVYADHLSANDSLGSDIRALAATGAPIVAECGGMLYLCESLDERPMLGLLPARAHFTSRMSLGYRTATLATSGVFGARGLRVRGHEFHRTATHPQASDSPAWTIDDADRREGYSTANIHASYVHPSWIGTPELADGLLHSASRIAKLGV
ncbi:cobyrinate a,c-diamide synthase [Haloglycomyces albus]|uniref:cobyrinate a,c-diamide synthase n=1 Tax=Haloglycomyces albus TaxID=526067 RepID=UPI00046D580F|nr:cobyrinate a,c-diamide synthase [Haloglycomyces albus]